MNSYLNSFINFETQLKNVDNSSFKLDRIYHLLESFGNPQTKYPVVHIAGSKGKGSTCSLLASILNKAHLKVGLYTSPHLLSIHERIEILGKGFINDQEFDELIETHKEKIEAIREKEDLGRLTFYEVFTALALSYFANQEMDVVILETGLGGRLDATNIVETQFVGITPISFEHTHILGNSLAAIAKEKAGIIKNANQKVVLASQEDEAKDVLLQACDRFDITPMMIDVDFSYRIKKMDWQGSSFDVIFEEDRLEDVFTPLIGVHQMANATMAIGMVQQMNKSGFSISNEAIYDGLASVRWPGRCEVAQDNPPVILDCAHNVASVKCLKYAVDTLKANKKVTLVLGISDDKDLEGMLPVLKDMADQIILTQSSHDRAYQWMDKDLEQFDSIPVTIVPKLNEAIDQAKTNVDDIIVVTGSVFLVGNVKEIIS